MRSGGGILPCPIRELVRQAGLRGSARLRPIAPGTAQANAALINRGCAKNAVTGARTYLPQRLGQLAPEPLEKLFAPVSFDTFPQIVTSSEHDLRQFAKALYADAGDGRCSARGHA
jgi:hypothetical protein